jgi:hypothetical protein
MPPFVSQMLGYHVQNSLQEKNHEFLRKFRFVDMGFHRVRQISHAVGVP